jgi:large subunit ribosomal protein L24
MSITKIQTGDQVKVIAGKYRGTVGQVIKVVSKQKGKTLVKRAAINTVPKINNYRKANKAFNVPGQLTTIDRLIDLSNLSLLTADGQTSRVKIEVKDSKKVRVLTKTGSLVERNKVTPLEENTLENK